MERKYSNSVAQVCVLPAPPTPHAHPCAPPAPPPAPRAPTAAARASHLGCATSLTAGETFAAAQIQKDHKRLAELEVHVNKIKVLAPTLTEPEP